MRGVGVVVPTAERTHRTVAVEEQEATTPGRRWRGRRWRLLATGWAAIYLVAVIAWAFGALNYPYGRQWDSSPVPVSLLDGIPRSTSIVIMVIAVSSMLAAAGTLLIRQRGGYTARAATGTILATCLGLVLVGDYRPLMAVARVPVFLVTHLVWHVAEGQVDVGEFVGAMFSVPALHGFWQLAGILLLLMAVVEFWRRANGGCTVCGRPARISWWTTRAGARKWGKIATVVAVICPLPYAVSRYMLLLGIPADGISAEQIRQGNIETPGIWIFGAGLATLGVLGAVLTLGLIQRWGERWPFWVPVLRGRPINPKVAILPAGFVSLLWPGSSLMLLRVNLQKTISEHETGSSLLHLVFAPMNLWIFWGFALAGATVAYWLRRRPDCSTCHRGEGPMRGIWQPAGRRTRATPAARSGATSIAEHAAAAERSR